MFALQQDEQKAISVTLFDYLIKYSCFLFETTLISNSLSLWNKKKRAKVDFAHSQAISVLNKLPLKVCTVGGFVEGCFETSKHLT